MVYTTMSCHYFYRLPNGSLSDDLKEFVISESITMEASMMAYYPVI